MNSPDRIASSIAQRARCCSIVLVWAIILMMPGRSVAADGDGQKKILVLYTDRRDLPSTGRVDDAHRIVLTEGLGSRLDYYSEYIDLIRFEDPKYQAALHEYLHTRYSEVRLDAVIAASTAVHRFRHGQPRSVWRRADCVCRQ